MEKERDSADLKVISSRGLACFIPASRPHDIFLAPPNCYLVWSAARAWPSIVSTWMPCHDMSKGTHSSWHVNLHCTPTSPLARHARPAKQPPGLGVEASIDQGQAGAGKLSKLPGPAANPMLHGRAAVSGLGLSTATPSSLIDHIPVCPYLSGDPHDPQIRIAPARPATPRQRIKGQRRVRGWQD